jgi:hypothetical protein
LYLRAILASLKIVSGVASSRSNSSKSVSLALFLKYL